MRSQNNRPPYLLGLLCLLPFIGFFVGIGLILYGILKYKDKWLVIMGATGITLTLLVYSFLFYNLKYSNSTSNSFAKISLIDLNSLAKNIEFYKIQTGEYPDSLEQIEKSDKTAIIEDPLQTRKLDKTINLNFNYRKIDKKYTLFSSGVDGIPNTPDDIYPDIFDTSLSKFGLIKHVLK